MNLLQRIKREGAGIILEEGPGCDELRRLAENFHDEYDHVYAHLIARGMSHAEIIARLRPPKPNGATGAEAPHKPNGGGPGHTRDGERADISQGGKRLVVQRASDITPEAVNWLWSGRIAVGKTTLIGGDPGLGKSQLAIAIVATISRGGQWPCGEGLAPKRSVIVLCAEDGAADTIVPRLMAAGADLSKIHIITAVKEADSTGRRLFNLSKDLNVLEPLINDIGDVGIVIIDPVDAYIGAGVDSHKNAAVRAVLEPISEMSDRLRVAIGAIRISPSSLAAKRSIGSLAALRISDRHASPSR